jgi:hypothetical protein
MRKLLALSALFAALVVPSAVAAPPSSPDDGGGSCDPGAVQYAYFGNYLVVQGCTGSGTWQTIWEGYV